jgi:hypothetical protein
LTCCGGRGAHPATAKHCPFRLATRRCWLCSRDARSRRPRGVCLLPSSHNTERRGRESLGRRGRARRTDGSRFADRRRRHGGRTLPTAPPSLEFRTRVRVRSPAPSTGFPSEHCRCEWRHRRVHTPCSCGSTNGEVRTTTWPTRAVTQIASRIVPRPADS